MRSLTYTLSLALLLGGLVLPGQASAEIIGADDFSESDGTGINGKAPDVGSGNWSGPGGQTIVGGVLDTAQVGQHQGSFLNLTRALGAGEVLVFTFQSAESAKQMFHIDGYAGMSFYIGGSEKLFVGDPGGGQAVNGWGADGFAGGGPTVYTTILDEAVSGRFAYHYDTGVATLRISGPSGTDYFTRNYDPGLALDRFRIQSGSTDNTGLAVDAFSVWAGQVPEPSTLAMVALSAVGLLTLARKR